MREQVTLAYAATVHAAHGRNVGAGYGVLGPGTDGPAAYVQATRGRDTNVLFVVTRHSDDAQHTGETARTARRTAAEVLADVIRPPEVDPNRTALTEAEPAAEEARATATHVDPLVTVIADLTAGRTQRWLDELAAAGQLPDHHRVALAADDARTHAGPAAAHGRAGRARPAPRPGRRRHREPAGRVDVGGAGAALPHPRGLRRPAAPRRSTATPTCCPATCPSRPATGCRPSPQAADARRAELGARLAQDPPQWAREALGPVPDADADPAGRAGWEQRAGWASSYRELVGHDDPADALGAAPPAGLAEKHAVFHAAHPRSTCPRSAPTRNGCPRASSAPAGPRGSANTTPRPATSPTSSTPPTTPSAAPAPTPPSGRPAPTPRPTRSSATSSPPPPGRPASRPSSSPRRSSSSSYADDARAVFLADTAVTRDRAERARVAAGLRGIDLDDQSDRVTAQEWLDAHLADQPAAEADREITEDDLAATTSTPPRRPTSRPRRRRRPRVPTRSRRADPTEQADPAARRRVPPPDATTAAVDRAQQVLREVAARQQAEQAAAAHAAELEPEDDQLRAELARQAAYDDATATSTRTPTTTGRCSTVRMTR